MFQNICLKMFQFFLGMVYTGNIRTLWHRKSDIKTWSSLKFLWILTNFLVCMLLSCHVRVLKWIHTLQLSECQGTPFSEQVKNTAQSQLNQLTSLANRLWTKWLWVRVQLQSLKLQISCLPRARISLTFKQL